MRDNQVLHFVLFHDILRFPNPNSKLMIANGKIISKANASHNTLQYNLIVSAQLLEL